MFLALGANRFVRGIITAFRQGTTFTVGFACLTNRAPMRDQIDMKSVYLVAVVAKGSIPALFVPFPRSLVPVHESESL